MARIATALAQRQTQKLAPAQQQALAVLQLPATALAAFVEAALAENPLLVRREDGDPARPPILRRQGIAIGRGGLPVMVPQWPAAALGDGADTLADPGPATLRAYLVDQLRLEIADPIDRTIGLHLIDLCEETGYLAGDPGEIPALLGVDAARVATVFERLRAFEPAGIFARDLADCLGLQLDAAERDDPAMRALLANLKLLAANDRARLATACGVGADRLEAMIRRIRSLDPKPGLKFAHSEPVWVVPDILVERDGDAPGGYRVRLNPAVIPGCDLDAAGYRRLANAARDRAEKAGLRAQYDNARGFLAALERRGATLLAIADAIVFHQRAFLESGVAALRPLTRRRIATEIGLDESTISRAVADKIMETPRGLFGFDFFFDRGLPGDPSKAVSAARLRARLAALLAAETEPLNDAALAGLLAAEGLTVARRTVAKYRESLNVPPANRRRGQAGLRRGDGNPHRP